MIDLEELRWCSGILSTILPNFPKAAARLFSIVWKERLLRCDRIRE